MANPTKAERREAWKQRTTATATALRSAGATVSHRTRKRSVPISATTVKPGQTESPLVQAHKAAGSPRTTSSPTSLTTSSVPISHLEVTRQKMLAMHPEPPTHREETRLRMLNREYEQRPDYHQYDSPRTTSSPTHVEDRYVPSVYAPGTTLEDVTYGSREEINRYGKQPQVHEYVWEKIKLIGPVVYGAGTFTGMKIESAGQQFAEQRPVIARAIHKPFEEFAAGAKFGAGERAIVPSVRPTEQFITRPIADFAIEKGADYRRFIESKREPIQEFVGTALGGRKLEPGEKESWAAKITPGTQAQWEATVGHAVVGALKSPAGFLEMGGMAAFGFEYMAKHPKESALLIPVAAGAMAGGTVRSFQERPWETGGEFTGMILGPKMLGKVPVPKTTWAPKLPGGGLVREIKTLVPRAEIGSGIKSPAGLAPGKAIKFEAGYKFAEQFGDVQFSTKPLDFTQIKYLPEKAGPAVETWIRAHPEQSPVIGGSTAAQVHFPSARKAADIDLLVKDPARAGKELLKVVEKEVEPGRVRLTTDPKWESAAVEIKTETGWHHAVDIHKTVEPGSQLRYGFETQKPITIEGIKYQRAGELFQRKAESVLQPSDPGTIGPTTTFRPQRIKDIVDFESQGRDILKLRKGQAESARFFSGYRQKQVGKTEGLFETYKMHSYMGPDPYMVVSAAKQYGALPLSARAGIALAGVSKYPIVKRELPEKAYDMYPSIKRDDGYYPADAYPITEKPYTSGYKPASKDDYYSPILKVSGTPTEYYPPYTPPKEDIYTPVYEPPYEPPYEPVYKPPYEPPYEPQFKFNDEPKKERKKEYDLTPTKKKALHPWFPASIEMVNLEESMTGKRAIHIGPRVTTQKLFKQLITTGRSIKTKAQYEKKLPTKFM